MVGYGDSEAYGKHETALYWDFKKRSREASIA
jgi:hypothetical protein